MKYCLVALGLVLLSCSSGVKRELLPASTCGVLDSFLAGELTAYQDRLDEVSRLYQEEQWRVETADPQASPQNLTKLFAKLQKTTYDGAVLSQAKRVQLATQGLEVGGCKNLPAFERAYAILERSILSDSRVVELEAKNQALQDKLSEKSNAFRIEVEGEKEPVSRALLGKKIASEGNRAAREKLYKTYGALRAKKWEEWGFRDLIQSRNAEARAAGFANYYEYRFFRNQLDLGEYRKHVLELKTTLAPKVAKAIAVLGKKHSISQVEAWDLRYLREKSADGQLNAWLAPLAEDQVMKVASHFYEQLGIHIASYGFVTDLYPRAGKNTHAFAMGLVFPRVDEKGNLLPLPKPDVRFVANLRKPVKWDDISTVIHELGHAVHMAEVRQPQAYFRGIGSVETEAFAMLLERMADSSEYLADMLPRFSGKKALEIRGELGRRQVATNLEQAIAILRQVFFSDFEYELYRNPQTDLAELWNRLHREYWGVAAMPQWADWDVEHFVSAPVYVQNYALGMLMVEQFMGALRRDFKTVFKSAQIGTKLKQTLFAPGVRFDYLALTQQFTGAKLSTQPVLSLIR